ncbi:hypothetical protein PUR59_36520 [Streptomyces sp. SP18ES09]|uniref:hypothetical protein n=1 Tax=Streptomyces sp. SP18ES09 TaxID=3002532 RepID=UPI002E766E07|nr:hypothetical protein [Streptomyces sp. SP18ES09]MEE1820507.1 hypothetical protein [Streptomyces sp. SP18ES09]
MDEARLSARERRVLAEIERELDRDVLLARRMRTMRRLRRPHVPSIPGSGSRHVSLGGAAGSHLLAVTVTLLGALTLALLVRGVVTGAPVVIWAFAGVWALNLTGLLLLVVRWTRRHEAAARTDG